ncbi:MAG: metallophosphoesterase [Planctomycetota bacterium]
MYDIIGDIHGHAAELKLLLEKLDYQLTSQGSYTHPSRKVLFCGDFIDRGPEIIETLRIVRSMCDSGTARAVIGNHEYNALAFHTEHPGKRGHFLRPQHERNIRQHRATLQQLSAAGIRDMLSWFETLPVSLDAGSARIVHACWDEQDLATIHRASESEGHLTLDFLVRSSNHDDRLFKAVERVLKGPEMHLPHGHFIIDREGGKRPVTRIRWFEAPDENSCASYSLPEIHDPELQQLPVPVHAKPAVYAPDLPPVFFGHYWLRGDDPQPLASNVACVDFSVARQGHLGCYRHHGESTLTAANFVTQESLHTDP